MTKEEMIAALKAEHGIDVTSLQEAAGVSEELVTALSAGSDDQITMTDLGNAIVELSHKSDEKDQVILDLSARLDAADTEKAEREVDALIAEGRLLPKQRIPMIALSRSDRETFNALVPDEALIPLSSEQGVQMPDVPESTGIADKVERYLQNTTRK